MQIHGAPDKCDKAPPVRCRGGREERTPQPWAPLQPQPASPNQWGRRVRRASTPLPLPHAIPPALTSARAWHLLRLARARCNHCGSWSARQGGLCSSARTPWTASRASAPASRSNARSATGLCLSRRWVHTPARPALPPLPHRHSTVPTTHTARPPIQLQFVRNDRVSAAGYSSAPVAATTEAPRRHRHSHHFDPSLLPSQKCETPKEGPASRDYCVPWWPTYCDSDRPTLLVANAGLHIHQLDEYRACGVAGGLLWLSAGGSRPRRTAPPAAHERRPAVLSPHRPSSTPSAP